MFCLIDCNNFYASCERLFRPDLINRPIVVLSNNDGCVVARSNESKALGIKMGIPFFEVEALCKKNEVIAFSSNYTLYGNLSDRVMSIIEDTWPETEIYSIDEAFLDLKTLAQKERKPFCEKLQKTILQQTGIPTTIGIGASKTLAKAANFIAKKQLKIPVFNIEEEKAWLAKMDVSDVWGVGHRLSKRLNALGINTALDLSLMMPSLVKKMFGVTLQKTALELRGISCLGLEGYEPKKSIMSSCSFGGLQRDYAYLSEACASHCATASAKMRRQGSIAQYLSVFVRSNPFRSDLKQYAKGIRFKLINPSDDVRLLTKITKICLKKIYKEGIAYHKCGVLLEELIPKNFHQMDMLDPKNDDAIKESERMMALMDAINQKYGARTIRLAAEGFNKTWSMKRQLKSPHYTTSWEHLPKAHIS